MKTKITVTDACIFIDLLELGLLSSFFNLELDVFTTNDVYHELFVDQKLALKSFEAMGKLTIFKLSEEDYADIASNLFPKGLSKADKSILLLANKLNACVLSSDRLLRNYAKNSNISYHGMLWIFDQLVESGTLTKLNASAKLKTLVEINFTFRNNNLLLSEIQKRLEAWKQ
jgi:predicted nucleic acid-binding protein